MLWIWSLYQLETFWPFWICWAVTWNRSRCDRHSPTWRLVLKEISASLLLVVPFEKSPLVECKWPAQPSLSTPTASHLAAGFTRPEELLPALWLSLQHPATAEEFSVAVDLLDVTFTAQVWGKVALPITDPQASPIHTGLTGPYPTLRGCVFSSTLSKFSWCTGSHGGQSHFCSNLSPWTSLCWGLAMRLGLSANGVPRHLMLYHYFIKKISTPKYPQFFGAKQIFFLTACLGVKQTLPV